MILSCILLSMLIASVHPGTAVKKSSAEQTPTAKASKAQEAKMETTIVTCSSLKVDYARNVAVFSGNVYVRDTGGKMWTDKMKVYFDPESHEIKTMVSTGKKVLINTGKKQSRSRKAVYTASDGRIVLTGKPRVYHGKNLYGAERITIFKGSDKIIFEPKASLIIKREKLEGMVDDTL